MKRSRSRVVADLAWSVGLAFFALNGGWAFGAPRSFYRIVAPWPPYNGHFLRDAGAFSLGVAGAILVGRLRRSGWVAGLAGAAAAAAFHAVSHVIDTGRGGRATDPYLLGALAVVLVIGAATSWRNEP